MFDEALNAMVATKAETEAGVKEEQGEQEAALPVRKAPTPSDRAVEFAASAASQAANAFEAAGQAARAATIELGLAVRLGSAPAPRRGRNVSSVSAGAKPSRG